MDTRERHSRDQLLEALLVKTSRTFALSIPLLPSPCRRETAVAYLLFRIADTFEDATAWTAAEQARALADFRGLLQDPTARTSEALARHWVERPPLDDPDYLELLRHAPDVVSAFAELEDSPREVVRAHVSRTAERMGAFVARSGLRLSTLDDLRAYCYAVAGIVGEMLTELFLLHWPQLHAEAEALRRRAARFGEALQLVNILKDAGADQQQGRCFVPPGVAREEVFALARSGLDEAERYIDALVRNGAPPGLVAFARLPLRLARPTLERVETEGPGSKLTRPEVMRIVVEVTAGLPQLRAAREGAGAHRSPRTG